MFLRRNSKHYLALQTKLVIGGLLILLLPLSVIGAVTFIRTMNSLEDISKLQKIQIAKSLSEMIRTAVEKNLKIISALAADERVVEAVEAGNFQSCNQRLADLYQIIGTDYEGIAIFDREGIIRADGADPNRAGIDISDRAYFQDARKGKVSIGQIVISKAMKIPGFGLSAPIFSKDGDVIGGVLGVVETAFLNRYIGSMKFGKTGFAFMTDTTGLTIVHPDQEVEMTRPFQKHPSLSGITDRMSRLETGAEGYIYDGVQKIIGFAPVEMTGWSIGVTQNRAEIMALAYGNRNIILLISVVFMGLTVLAVIFFSRSVSIPVEKTLATLNTAVSQAAEAFVIIGKNRKVQFANPALGAIIDRSVSEMTGKEFDMEGIDRDDLWKNLLDMWKWSGRVTGLRSDGSAYTMEFSITPVLERGEVSCYLGIGRDVTHEIVMQERIRQSEKMEAIGTLAGGIAHDFNNILSGIIGYTELALLDIEDRPAAQQKLKRVLAAGKRAGELVKQILTFSRKLKREAELISPAAIVKEVIKLMRASLPSNIEIRHLIQSDNNILADATNIHQVLMNLCTNAAHAMKLKGGILSVILEEVTLGRDDLSHHPDAKPGVYLKLSVTDTGIGMTKDIQLKAFDPFFTTKDLGEGTGMGLSTVHGIITELGGFISLNSQPGLGTSIHVFIPCPPVPDAIEEGPASQSLQGGTERILFVDDEQMQVDLAKDTLMRYGYQITTFLDSNMALDHFLQNPYKYDLIITDMTMPKMAGDLLTQKIRSKRPDIPVILCTGFSEVMDEEKAQAMGIHAFLLKPVVMEKMLKAIRFVLDSKLQGEVNLSESGTDRNSNFCRIQ